jgi:chromosome segregation ATPase
MNAQDKISLEQRLQITTLKHERLAKDCEVLTERNTLLEAEAQKYQSERDEQLQRIAKEKSNTQKLKDKIESLAAQNKEAATATEKVVVEKVALVKQIEQQQSTISSKDSDIEHLEKRAREVESKLDELVSMNWQQRFDEKERECERLRHSLMAQENLDQVSTDANVDAMKVRKFSHFLCV